MTGGGGKPGMTAGVIMVQARLRLLNGAWPDGQLQVKQAVTVTQQRKHFMVHLPAIVKVDSSFESVKPYTLE